MYSGICTKRALALTIATFSISTMFVAQVALAAGPTAADELTTVPEDAQMGDGLRSYEAGAAGLTAEVEPKTAVCASGTTLKGIDVSKWQGNVDWDQVAADGVEFAFVRVSDGLNTPDQFFAQNWQEARAAGVTVGAYQFFRPKQDAIAQANLMLSKMGELREGDLPPVIDVEDHGNLSSTQVAAKVKQWVDHVEAETGIRPIIYTGRFFWQDYVKTSAYSDYPLWIAHYTSGCPNLPSQWSDWTFHQFTDSGSIDGVSGPTDTNRFNGNLAALAALTVGGSGPDDDEDEPEPPSGCDAITSSGATIDDGDPCYVFNGPSQWWRTVSGQGGDAKWTGTTKTTVTNFAEVKFDFDEAGRFRIEAYIAGANATSRQAKYKVMHADGQATITVNQSTKSGWTSLGDFNFDAGTGQLLSLADATGEANSLGRRVSFDSVRLTYLGPPSSNNAAPAQDDDDGAGWPGGVERGDDAQGCAVAPAHTGGAWWCMLALAGLLRRRRVA